MKPTVTEQTGKKYKGAMLVALMICCVSVIFILEGSRPLVGVGGFIAGLLVYFFARIGAWWNHR